MQQSTAKRGQGLLEIHITLDASKSPVNLRLNSYFPLAKPQAKTGSDREKGFSRCSPYEGRGDGLEVGLGLAFFNGGVREFAGWMD